MKLETKFFGTIDIVQDKVIKFEEGILGFEDLKEYLLMTDEDEKGPFLWLQSIEDVNVVFTLFNILDYIKDYEPIVEKEYIKTLGEFELDDLLIYTIANVPKDVKSLSINLKAPLVINMNNNKAKQVISKNEDYPIKYFIYDKLKEGDKEC